MSEMTLDMRLFAAEVRVTDGVYGTELQAQCLLKPGECAELLNADNPTAVEAVARSYVEAGADAGKKDETAELTAKAAFPPCSWACLHRVTETREVPTAFATFAAFIPCSNNAIAIRRHCSNSADVPFGLMEVPIPSTERRIGIIRYVRNTMVNDVGEDPQ